MALSVSLTQSIGDGWTSSNQLSIIRAMNESPARLPSAEECPLLTVPEAGAFVHLGYTASYEAARRGDLPTIRLGRRLFVPTAKLRELLGLPPAGG